MKYFKVQYSLNEKITGKLPQVKDVIYNSNDVFNDEKFIDNFYLKKAPQDVIVANPIIYSHSKKTDLIQVGGVGFQSKYVVSTKLKELLISNKGINFQFFQCKIFHKNFEDIEYWLLNPYDVDNSQIDFENTDVFLTENTIKTNKKEIKNQNEYIDFFLKVEKQGYPSGVILENIKIKNENNLAFFVLKNIEGGTGFIVSEKLKEKIETAGCSGLEFQPIELSYNEWVVSGGEREKTYGKF